MKSIRSAVLLVCVLVSPAQAATIAVKAGGDLQAALNAAQPGDVIELAAGATFNGQYQFPAKAGTVTLRTVGVLPSRRLTATDGSTLALIQSPYAEKALSIVNSANWTIDGVRFATNITGAGEVILIQDSDRITLDRLFIDVPSVSTQKRFITGNGTNITLTRSFIRGIRRVGQDSQCFDAWDGAGPYTITDNHLECAGENVMFGGADSQTAARMPSDILIENNLLTKDLAWKAQSGQVKNLLELKAARRVIIRGNTLEHNWVDAQQGRAIVFTPRNQDGKAPWSVVEDVLVEKNTVRDTPVAINLLGRDDLSVSGQATRITVRDNTLDSSWIAILTLGELGAVEFYRNTITVPAGTGAVYIAAEGNVMTTTGPRPVAYAAQSFVWASNTLPNGGHFQSPVTNSASANGGLLALQTYTQSYSLTVPTTTLPTPPATPPSQPPPPPALTDRDRVAQALALLKPLESKLTGKALTNVRNIITRLLTLMGQVQ